MLYSINEDDPEYALYGPIAKNKDVNLLEAIKRNRLEILEAMFEKGIDFNTIMEGHVMTPIEAAALWGQVEVIMFLLTKCSVHIDHLNVLHQTALYKALQHRRFEIVQLLLKNKTSLQNKDAFGQTPLVFFLTSCVCQSDVDLALIELLIRSGADMCAMDSQTGMMPLHMAICKSPIPGKILELFFRAGNIDASVKCKGGWSPLHFICANPDDHSQVPKIQKKMQCDVVTVLLKNNAEANATDELYQTPLHFCARNGLAKAAEILLEFGADPLLRDIDGNRAIEYAAEKSGVWYILREAIRKKRASGNLPATASPMTTRKAEVTTDVVGEDCTDSAPARPMLSSIGRKPSINSNPRDMAWNKVYDRVMELENSIDKKYGTGLSKEIENLKKAMNSLKSQEDTIFAMIWPTGVPSTINVMSAEESNPRSSVQPSDAKDSLFSTAADKSITGSDESLSSADDDEKILTKASLQASKMMGQKWKMIFRHFEVYSNTDMTENAISEILLAYPADLQEQSYQSLLKWRKIKGREATLKKLLDTLEQCECVNISHRIEETLAV